MTRLNPFQRQHIRTTDRTTDTAIAILIWAMVVWVAAAGFLARSGWEPSAGLVAVVGIGTSAGLLIVAWRQRNTLDERPDAAEHAETLRTIGSTTERVRALYTAVVLVSAAALIWSAATSALLSASTNRAAVTISVSTAAALVAWPILATISLIRLDTFRSRSIALHLAMREQADADRRNASPPDQTQRS